MTSEEKKLLELEIIKQMRSTSDDVTLIYYGPKEVNGQIGNGNGNAIVFSVKKKKPLEELSESEIIPKSIQVGDINIKTDVVEGVVQRGVTYTNAGSCSTYADWITTPPINRQEFRPLKGGISLTNYTNNSGSTGTGGLICVDDDTNSLCMLSNNHVLINDAFITSNRSASLNIDTNVSGSVCTQPNESGVSSLTYRVGVVKKYWPIGDAYYSGSGTISEYNGVNQIDAAIVAIDPPSVTTNLVFTGSWEQVGLTGSVISSPPQFATTAEIDYIIANSASANLYMTGRTTGAKGQGTIKLKIQSGSGLSLLAYDRQGGSVACWMFPCIIYRAPGGSDLTPGTYCFWPSWRGDSGASVLAEISGSLKIVGLNFAGSYITISGSQYGINGIACRMDLVAEKLNLSAWNGTTFNYTDTTTSSYVIVDGTSNLAKSASIQIGGSTYWQLGAVTGSTFPPNYP